MDSTITNWLHKLSDDQKKIMLGLALSLQDVITQQGLFQTLGQYQIKGQNTNKAISKPELAAFMRELSNAGFITTRAGIGSTLAPGLRYTILRYFEQEYPEYYELKIEIFNKHKENPFYKSKIYAVLLNMAILKDNTEEFELLQTLSEKALGRPPREELVQLLYIAGFVDQLKTIQLPIYEYVVDVYIENLVSSDLFEIGLLDIMHMRQPEYQSISHQLFLDEFYLANFHFDKLSDSKLIHNQAIVCFLKGEFDKSQELLDEYQIAYNKTTNTNRKHLPGIFGTVYTLLKIKSAKTPAEVKLTGTYVNNQIKEKPVSVAGLKALFNVFHKGAKEHSEIGTLSGYYGEGQGVFNLISTYWLDKKKFKSHVTRITDVFEGARLFGTKMLYHTFLDACKREGIAIPVEYNESIEYSFLDLIQPPADWEKDIKLLESFSQKSSPIVATEDASRLTWQVNIQEQELLPIEQKRTKTGTWTKGRKVALKRLKEGKVPNMTPQDIKIASKIRTYSSYGYYYNDEYELELVRAVEYLVGHPLLFLTSAPTTSVKVVEEKPELLVKQLKNGYSISLEDQTKKAFRDDLGLIKESLTKYLYYHFDKKLLDFFQKLNDSPLFFPKEAKDRFEKAVHNLSAFVQVNADFLTEQLPTVTADATPILQLIPHHEGILGKLLVRPFEQEGPTFTPTEGRENVVAQIGAEKIQTKRNFKEEKKNVTKVLRDLPALDLDDYSEELDYQEPEDCLELLGDLFNYKGRLKVEWPQGEKLKIVNQLDFGSIKMSVNKRNEWFEVDGEVQVSRNKVMKIKELLERASQAKKQFVKLDDGQYLALTKQLKNRLEVLQAATQEQGDTLQLHPLLAPTLQDLEENGVKLKADKHWKENKKLVEEVKAYQPEVPSTLQAELRPYQKEGYEWMMRLSKMGFGACLADDMGLGKTIQSLAMLIDKAPQGPSVVVAPASVCANWVSEMHKFAPSLNPVSLGLKDRAKTIQALTSFDVLVISYGVVQTEIENLSAKEWNAIVVDEAHAIKNVNTKRTKALNQLKGAFKLIATGTPLQNNLEELWSLFNFVNPGLLFSQKEFGTKFINAAENEKSKKLLKSIITPYILRRNKTQVLDDLPEKTQITLSVEMTEEETAFYEALREKAIENMEKLNEEGGKKNMQVLAEITRLRQACCNPSLIEPSWKQGSSKLKIFERTLDDLLENNHKCLVFSQFTSHLAIIEDLLKKKKISYQYLDGSTPLKAREKRVKAFQAGEGDVFLISLKAGGVGLNLTSADYVIHMDPWWNPAIEDQASDRAHRIGQTRPVTIYRLVTKNTIEEKIVQLHHTKRDLADSLLEGTDKSSKLTAEDMVKILKGTY